jgi:predicted  nucleic acid-binding Zn-ribbon protein
MRPLILPVIFLTFLLAEGLMHPNISAAEQAVPAERLVVDFTNRESRSISLRVGSADGINAEMNFAVLDSAGMQIAEFFPHEIMTDRFWSGPLDQENFARVRTGDPVIRINLNQNEAARLREQFHDRMVLLREEQRKRRLELLGEAKVDLEEQINELDVESVGLKNDIKSLQEELKREKSLSQRHIDDLQEQIDELRDERSELTTEREELLDKRDTLLRRSDPPQDRISDLNAEIADLDREIGQFNLEIDDLRDDIRDLREESRELEEEIREVREEQRELELERKELKLEMDDIIQEIEELKKRGER